MAQPRRRRQTKHRGNAAGVVEVRGRTGRKPTAAEKSGDPAKVRAERTKVDRRDKPPTWGGSFIRSMFASVLMLLVLLFVLKSRSNSVIALFPVALIIYTPVSYYTERWAYNRRQRGKAAGASVR